VSTTSFPELAVCFATLFFLVHKFSHRVLFPSVFFVCANATHFLAVFVSHLCIRLPHAGPRVVRTGPTPFRVDIILDD